MDKNKFIEISNKLHNGRYLYDLVPQEFCVNSKVTIICNIHGTFSQNAYKHYKLGRGCNNCGGSKKMSWNEIVFKASIKHDNKYEYPAQHFENGRSKIDIICPKHGSFIQSIESHLVGTGCPFCGGSKRHSIESIVKLFNKTHSNKYEYSIGEYKNHDQKINIICPKHGSFKQKISNHSSGQGCPCCYRESKKYSVEEYINFCKKVHNYFYTYENIDIDNFITYISHIYINCPIHGIFKQNARSHLRGSGCPKCNKTNTSKGELKIERYLKLKGIEFITQMSFDGCFLKRKLPFDFYLPKQNICIEYDGKHHFKSIEYFGGDKFLEKVKLRDKIKEDFCNKNDMKLVRIKYTDNKNIEMVIDNEIQI